jgi:methanogenic corrinoid protein MtbC1
MHGIGILQLHQDLACHIEFLSYALETGSPECFSNYITLAAASSRGLDLPPQSLVEALRQLHEFYRRRLTRAEVAAIDPFLKRALTALQQSAGRTRPLAHISLPDPVPQVDDLIERLLAADIVGARMIAAQVAEEINGYLTVATRLVQPAMYRIGQLWERNELSVAEEHLASAIARSLLTHLMVDAPTVQRAGRNAVFACVEGNNHDLGLQVVADAFALDGWAVHHLGANTPSEALLRYINVHRPELLGLSACLVQQLPAMRRVVQQVRQEMGSDCPKVLVGGLATNQMHQVWRWLGADVWSPDASTVLDAVSLTMDGDLPTAC